MIDRYPLQCVFSFLSLLMATLKLKAFETVTPSEINHDL